MLTALHRADPFLTGLYIEASRGTGRILLPSLCVLAAERHTPGAGPHAAALRFADHVPFATAHTQDAMAWPGVEWPVIHAAAIAWQSAKAGEPATVLSLRTISAGAGPTPRSR